MTIRKTTAIPAPITMAREREIAVTLNGANVSEVGNDNTKLRGVKVNTRHTHHGLSHFTNGRVGSPSHPRPTLLQRRALEKNDMPMLEDRRLNVTSEANGDDIVIMSANKGLSVIPPSVIRHKRSKSLTHLYSPSIHIASKRQSREVEVLHTPSTCDTPSIPITSNNAVAANSPKVPSIGRKRSIKHRENRVKPSKRCKEKHKKGKQPNTLLQQALKRFRDEERHVDSSLRCFTLTMVGHDATETKVDRYHQTGNESTPIHVHIGVAASQGARPYMEDCFSVTMQLFGDESDEWISQISLLAIYDGHNGIVAAEYANQRMQTLLAENPFLQSLGRRCQDELLCQDDVDHIKQILCTTFAILDQEVLEMTMDRNRRDGATVLIGLMVAGKLFVANVGDSRGVYSWIKDEEQYIERISVDHKPDLPDETTRIEEAGGKVIFSGCWRVAHDEIPLRLAVSRSLGDHPLKENLPVTCTGPLVSVIPDIHVLDICSQDSEDLIVFATDGLWDRLTDEDAVEMARAHINLYNNKTSNVMQSAANTLIEAALTKRSMDNITVMVIGCSRQSMEQVF